MIDLTERQQETLNRLLAEESKIPVERHVFSIYGDEIALVGRMLPRNKLVAGRESGYMNYIETNEGLITLSAFTYEYQGVHDE